MLTNYFKKKIINKFINEVINNLSRSEKTCCMQPINLQQHIINCLIM
jgi:hypothetical protein